MGSPPPHLIREANKNEALKSVAWKLFHHSPAVISKNFKQTIKKKIVKKAEKSQEEKIIYQKWKIYKKNKFAAAWVKIFLVIRISRNKDKFLFRPEHPRKGPSWIGLCNFFCMREVQSSNPFLVPIIFNEVKADARH